MADGHYFRSIFQVPLHLVDWIRVVLTAVSLNETGFELQRLEIKPCGLGSRIRYVEDE
jgi:hypothetical protein